MALRKDALQRHLFVDNARRAQRNPLLTARGKRDDVRKPWSGHTKAHKSD